MGKQAVNLYADPKLVDEARRLGGNPSKILEIALKQFIEKNKKKGSRE